MRLERLFMKPIITPETDETIGENINGPTLMRVPSWLKNPLGKYYLYFAHHRGSFIRLAYSDTIDGPWKIYKPGVLQLSDCPHLEQNPANNIGHIASPDIYIDEENKRFLMYYHGSLPGSVNLRNQFTFVATSEDGIDFDSSYDEILGFTYMRAFKHDDGYLYTLDMAGKFRRSKDGISNFEEGPNLYGEEDVYSRKFDVRHHCFLKKGNTLYMMFTIREACPESLCITSMDISKDWTEWKFDSYEKLLEPEMDYEGVNYPLEPSKWGDQINVRQLRDPFMYEKDGVTYVFYTVAGECGIAVAKLIW